MRIILNNEAKATAIESLVGDRFTTVTMSGVVEWRETDYVTKVTTRYQAEARVELDIGELFLSVADKAARNRSGKASLGYRLVRGFRTGPVLTIGPVEAK